MTIDEAIKTLTQLEGYPITSYAGKDIGALKLGIGALQQIAQMRLLNISPIAELLPGETE